MRFIFDENVPMDVAEMLERRGHVSEFIRDYVPPGSPDPLVATVAEEINAVLVSFDGDFQHIAPRIPQGQRSRFRRLSRIWMRCDEPAAADRFEQALALIKSEFELALHRPDSRMLIWIGSSYLRTDR